MSTGNTQPAQGGITGLLAKAPDPLGLSNGGGGLDPLNLMGSPTSAIPVPSVLPTLGGSSTVPIQPYGKFVAPNTTGGGFNAMAAHGAGPLFNPSSGAPSWQALMAQAVKNQPTAVPAASANNSKTPSLALNSLNNILPGIGGGQAKVALRLLAGL